MIGPNTTANGGTYLLLSFLSVGSLLLAWLIATNGGFVAAKILPTPQAIGHEV